MLIRQLQEMWLFGQLNTVGDSKVQEKTDANARAASDLLRQLMERQSSTSVQSDMGEPAENSANGMVTNGV